VGIERAIIPVIEKERNERSRERSYIANPNLLPEISSLMMPEIYDEI